MIVASYLRQLGKESAVYGLSSLVGKVIAVVLMPIYTRVFAPSDYGIIALLTTLIDLINVFVLLALDSAAARWYYNSQRPEDQRSTVASWFWCQLLVRLASSACLFVFAQTISVVLLGTATHAILVRLAAVGYVATAPGAIGAQWLRFTRRPVLAVSYGLGQTLLNVALTLLFVVVFRYGLQGLYTAQLLATMLAAAVALVLLRGWLSLRLVSLRHLIPMLRYAVPLMPAAVAYWAMGFSDRFILSVFCDTTEIGLYSVAGSLAGAISLIVGAFGAAWGPFAYSIMADSNADRVYSRVLDVYAFGMCALCAALTVFAPLLLRILTTEPYYPAASCVPFLAFAAALEGARAIVSLGSGIAKTSLPVAVSLGIGATISIAMNFALIPFFGRDGAAVAKTFAYASAVAYQFFASQRCHPIPYRWVPGLVSFLVAWSIIAVDRLLLPEMGLWPALARLVLLASFLPLGVSLGLLRTTYIKDLLRSAPQGSPAAVSESASRS